MRRYGLIGKSLKHTFSPSYFAKKFVDEHIADASYGIFELSDISDIKEVFNQSPAGLNVTIPYKEAVLPYMDYLSDAARGIGAVNTILFQENNIIGHNTDVSGFTKSLLQHLDHETGSQSALILGSGGASKAVQFAFKQLDIPYHVVSRSKGEYKYEDLSSQIFDQNTIIVNTTPLGMYPNIDGCPAIPIQFLSAHHLVFDLVYNPPKTKLLLQAEQKGATIVNGYDMLVYQAEESWYAWNHSKEFM